MCACLLSKNKIKKRNHQNFKHFFYVAIQIIIIIIIIITIMIFLLTLLALRKAQISACKTYKLIFISFFFY